MLYYDKIDLGEGIDLTENKKSKKCIVCHYWYFNHDFKFKKSVCNDCHDLLMLRLKRNNITIITVKGIDYRCIIHDISISDVIHLLENSVLHDCRYIKMHFKELNIKNRIYNYYFGYLIKTKKIDTKDVLVYEKNYKDLIIYFTRYDHGKSMLSLYYHELMEKSEDYKGKKYFIIDDYILNKVLDKIKMIIGI